MKMKSLILLNVKGKRAATGTKGHLIWTSYRFAFILVKKDNVVGKIFKGVAQRADVIQLPFVFVFVLVLHLYLYLYWLDAKEGKRWDGASCHSTAARFIKLSADALLSPQLNPLLINWAVVIALFLLRQVWGATWPFVTNWLFCYISYDHMNHFCFENWNLIWFDFNTHSNIAS